MAAVKGPSDIVLILLAIFLPPIAVFLRRGCGAQLLINIVLWLFGHIPGAIHALYIVLHDEGRRVSRSQAPYPQQTNSQAMYGTPAQPAPGDNNVQQQPYGVKTQEPYFDQRRAMAPEPTPTVPTYTDESHMRGEKQEYAPVTNGGLSKKEI
jgi:uncharacterized membrane protein YqaE (UPF0057 family)